MPPAAEESVGVEVVIGLWLLLGIFFILRVPDSVHTYDVEGHIQYTQIIARQDRLPEPLEGHETFQPPLYYLINSRIAPFSHRHVFWVRYLSVFYGALALGGIALLLADLRIPPMRRIFILAFLITTPMFVFVFSSYNNDSLATVFSVFILLLLSRLVHQWTSTTAIGLWAAIAAGLYTKFTVGFTVIVAGLILLVVAYRERWSLRQLAALLGVLGTPVVVLIPWLVFHNHALTGRYLPTVYDVGLPKQIALPQSPSATLVAIPCLEPNEWRDPFAHLWEQDGSKKSSYLSYRFCTSLFGEYVFPPGLALWAWWIVAAHLCALLWAVQYAHKSRIAQVALGFILLSAIPQYIYMRSCPYGSAMDFRYIAWVWMPWAVVFAELGTIPLWGFLSAGTAVQGLFLFGLMR